MLQCEAILNPNLSSPWAVSREHERFLDMIEGFKTLLQI